MHVVLCNCGDVWLPTLPLLAPPRAATLSTYTQDRSLYHVGGVQGCHMMGQIAMKPDRGYYGCAAAAAAVAPPILRCPFCAAADAPQLLLRRCCAASQEEGPMMGQQRAIATMACNCQP